MDRYLDAAIATACWIDAAGKTTRVGRVWPSDPRDPASVDASLYRGMPGPILFFLDLARRTGSPSWLNAAVAGADALLAAADGHRPAGLYTGIAGVAFTLANAFRATGERRFRDGALNGVRRLRTLARREGRGIEWSTNPDIVSGTSGIGFALLWLARELAADEALTLAKDAGHRLIDGAHQPAPGQLKWIDPSSAREMPNFAHGTAGVASFLAALAESTGIGEFLDAALAGAAHLLAIADTANDTFAIRHHDGDEGGPLYYLGWCHGPAGTSRLFERLYRATGDRQWPMWTARAVGGIVTRGGPERIVDPGLWNNSGICCGVAGQAQFFMNVHRLIGAGRDLSLARAAADLLLARAVRDDRGLCWVHAEHRTRPDLLAAQTGYMQGASGIAAALLRLSAIEASSNTSVIALPDDCLPETTAE